jgi:hypothetical protein
LAIINKVKVGSSNYDIVGSNFYGSCSTAAGTAAKTVSVDGTFTLYTGATVAVKFTVTNTAKNPTLNVDSTGAKAIYYNGAAISAGYLKANKVYMFVYNGAQWDFIGDIDTNTTYTSLKNPSSLTIQGNGTTLTNGTYDGSAAKTVNITPSAIGAAASSHTHSISNITNLQSSLDNKLSLSGGTLTGEIAIGQGDGKGVQLGANGRFNATYNGASDYTVLGMMNGNFTLGSSSIPTILRGGSYIQVSNEMRFNGGDTTGGSKIVLETNKGQITNSGTGTLFGYTADDVLAVGHSSAALNFRGSGAAPTYNGIAISLNGHTHSAATTSAAGLMSAADKKKLDGVATGANNYTYTLPAATSSALGGVKVGSNISNSSGTISLTKSNVTSALGYTPPTTNTTYSNATTSAAGLMSAADKNKLNSMVAIYNAGVTFNNSGIATVSNSAFKTTSAYFLQRRGATSGSSINEVYACHCGTNGTLTIARSLGNVSGTVNLNIFVANP